MSFVQAATEPFDLRSDRLTPGSLVDEPVIQVHYLQDRLRDEDVVAHVEGPSPKDRHNFVLTSSLSLPKLFGKQLGESLWSGCELRIAAISRPCEATVAADRRHLAD